MQYINRKHRQFQLKSNRMMEERRLFMKELKEVRAAVTKDFRREIKDNVGPTWYQVLSVRHKMALGTLSTAIYQDILEGRPVRTLKIIRILGILPCPNKLAIQHCMYLGRSDPKEFLAHLFHTMYNHPISAKRYSYDLNMKIILSSIFHLGLDDLIKSLAEQFKPEEPVLVPVVTKKKRAVVHSSPYLQKMVVPLYQPAVPKRKPPPPLPDLSFLNAIVEIESTPQILKPSPPALPPPPLKKWTDRRKCDKLADVISFTQAVEPKVSRKLAVNKKIPSFRKLRSSKTPSIHGTKKKYGIGNTRTRKIRNLKPKAPSTGLQNIQYNIVGIYTYKEYSYFIIGDVFTLPPQGILLNGGQALLPNGKYGLIHLGFGGYLPLASETCECLEKWENAVVSHIQNTKCYCDHRFDFGNEGTFSEDEVPFFTKPTRKGPMHFNYNAIYETDPKIIQVHKEVKKLWEIESILQDDNDSEVVERRRKKKKKKEALKVMSQVKRDCLGDQPVMEDYLRCGVRFLGRINVAARLPDVHLAPELKAWMRLRIYGPYTTEEKNEMFRRSMYYWSYFKAFQNMSLGKVKLPAGSSFSPQTTWRYKPEINVKFKKNVYDHQVKLYKAQAKANNMLWATAYNAEYPDKKFREVYFTYLAGRVEDVVLYHPYCPQETRQRATNLRRQPSLYSRSN